MFLFRIKVLRHKTDLAYGAARICLPKNEYQNLVAYIRTVRLRCPGFDQASSAVFFTADTPHLTSSSNYNTMRAMCRKLESRGCSNTAIREWLSSMVNAISYSQCIVLANLPCVLAVEPHEYWKPNFFSLKSTSGERSKKCVWYRATTLNFC